MALPAPVATVAARHPAAAPLLVGGAAAAGCVVVGLVNPSETMLFPPCPFRALTGLDCPGCGATRAVHQLLNGNVQAAVGFNAVLILALPFFVWGWLAWTVASLGGPRLPSVRLNSKLSQAFVAVLFAFMAVRNLPFQPFSALGTD